MAVMTVMMLDLIQRHSERLMWAMIVVLGLMASSGLAYGQFTGGEQIIAVRSGDAVAPNKQNRSMLDSFQVVNTLEEAVTLARRLRTSAAGSAVATSSAAIVIELQPGIHRLTEPLRLSARDSGTIERPLIIRSAAAGPAVIRGSQTIVATSPTSAELARFPLASRPHLKAYNLPTSAADTPLVDISRRHDTHPGPVPFEVFDGEGALRPARWPNGGWTTGTSRSEGGITFSADPDRMARWKDERELWVSGFFRWNWAYETRPATTVGFAGELALESVPQYGFAKTFRMAVHHAASELDEPGEWVRLLDRRRLIVWPRDRAAELEISVAEQLIVIDGARHVRLEGLTLERVRGEAIAVRDGHDIAIAGCTIRLTGGRAISVEGGLRNSVSGGRIDDAGEGGVRLSGGDRQTLQSAGHSVSDTVIRRFSRLGLTCRPAVSLEGVGNRAEGNAISDGPHMAIFFSGNDHIITLNEIADVVADTSDAGAIYTGRDWTAQGTVIKHNFIHDVRSHDGFEVKGVYLDDFASGIMVDANLFVRVDQPVFIGGGRDNVISNNVFIASQPAVYIDGRGRTWATDAISKPTSELYTALAAVPTKSMSWIERYPRLYSLLADDPADPKRNVASGNRVMAGKVYELLPEVKASQQRLELADATRPSLKAATYGRSNAAELSRRAVEMEPDIRAAFTHRPSAELPYSQMDRATILAARVPVPR
jgi:Right handed beta helix region